MLRRVTWDLNSISRSKSSASMPLLTDGYRQPIGVQVLRDSDAKDLRRLLKTGNARFDHPFVEFVKIGHTQTGTAPSGSLPRDILIRYRHHRCV